ncbi:MAG: DUF1156 domain-containing protein [Promethearchaeota archaeon]
MSSLTSTVPAPAGAGNPSPSAEVGRDVDAGKGATSGGGGAGGRGRALIEEWFPFEDTSIECIRERGVVSALPPLNYLHVWWARRPLTLAKAAVLASVLPATTDRDLFSRELMGFSSTLREKYREILEVKASGSKRRVGYDGPRVFTLNPPTEATRSFRNLVREAWGKFPVTVLDPMGGGGSIPFECCRLGLSTLTSDLNPVAATILRASVKFPVELGGRLSERLSEVQAKLLEEVGEDLARYFPGEDDPGRTVDGYIWVRTAPCPSSECRLAVPLSPTWKLSLKREKAILRVVVPPGEGGSCEFDIVAGPSDSELAVAGEGTVHRGSAECPRCGSALPREYIRECARAGKMGHQLVAVVYLEPVAKGSKRKVRKFRSPGPKDVEALAEVEAILPSRTREWNKWKLLPVEETVDPVLRRNGLDQWFQLFNPRQLLANVTILEKILAVREELLGSPGSGHAEAEAIVTYLALAFDKVLNYNSILTVWMPLREVVVNTFNRHDFTVSWSYSEMAVVEKGLPWAFENVNKAYRRLVDLLPDYRPEVEVWQGAAQDLGRVAAGSVEVVVVDPPYYDNVAYATLSDYFYTWLKRLLGPFHPGEFSAPLTDKEMEAVASERPPVGSTEPYELKMRASFGEIHRVLKPGGIMTLMFTHKTDRAWEVLLRALIDAGFEVTATWPVHAESSISMHIANKEAARITVLMACRKRKGRGSRGHTGDEGGSGDGNATSLAEFVDVSREVVTVRGGQFREAGIEGLDLELAVVGAVLGVFSTQYPVVDGESGTRVTAGDAVAIARQLVNELL